MRGNCELEFLFRGSVHQNQSDTPFLFGFVGRALGGCWSALDKDLAMTLNNRLMVNFICRQLGELPSEAIIRGGGVACTPPLPLL